MKTKQTAKSIFQAEIKVEALMTIAILIIIFILGAIIGGMAMHQKADIQDKVGSMHAYLHQKDSQYQSFEDDYCKQKAAERALKNLI